jgi:hypothetical protein
MKRHTYVDRMGALKRQLCCSPRSPKRKPLFWLGMILTAIAVAGPQSAYGQQCAGNANVGCTKAGAVCSPVAMGQGPGKCVTPGGFPKGELSCVCEGTPLPPTIPAECSNPTLKGTANCTIIEPVVNQATAGYQILFAPGDQVVVTASGCVQTGGSGLTWKNYVNPSGANSDKLYHGLIQLPGTQMVRINTIVGKPLTVSQYGSLILGYEDNAYTDNGYSSPDNGTGNQCKGIGPAQVTITITR